MAAELFETHELVRNEREIRKIEVSEEATALSPWSTLTPCGAIEGNERWKGRVCKVYSKVGSEDHHAHGVLEYR